MRPFDVEPGPDFPLSAFWEFMIMLFQSTVAILD